MTSSRDAGRSVRLTIFVVVSLVSVLILLCIFAYGATLMSQRKNNTIIELEKVTKNNKIMYPLAAEFVKFTKELPTLYGHFTDRSLYKAIREARNRIIYVRGIDTRAPEGIEIRLNGKKMSLPDYEFGPMKNLEAYYFLREFDIPVPVNEKDGQEDQLMINGSWVKVDRERNPE